MRFIDFFAGVGGFRRGLEMAGHECVGFCEWDKFATASYTAMHIATPEQLAFLETLPKSERIKEILKSEYRNGEWYSNDVRSVTGGNCPEADCYCFGAPCQDFSTNGLRKGLAGDRSSLVGEIFRIVGEQANKPEWLVYENVTGMLSSNRGWDYFAILSEMDRLGYDVEWGVFNSKDYGVPQDRKRVYTIGHFREYGRREILPVTDDDEIGVELQRDADHCGIITNTLTARYGSAMSSGTYVLEGINNAALRANGFSKNDSCEVEVKDGTVKGFSVARPGDVIDISYPGSATRRGRVSHNVAHTLDTACAQAVLLTAAHNKRNDTETFIRRLTPRECFRLQGWADDYYDRAALINSDTQLYKQAGNCVTVNVVYEIGKRLAEAERENI